MSRRAIFITAGVAVGAVLIIGGFAVWYLVFRDDAPPPVALDEAVASATTTTTVPEDASAAATTEPPAEPDPTAPATTEAPATGASDSVDGTWNVDTSLESFVGYRVQEELANLGAKTAVGRTAALESSLEIEGATITAVAIQADMTQLQSDDSRRDGQMERQSLETDTFPTATFVLTQPIDLGAVPAIGEPVAVTAVGDLTIHGVTNSVEIPIEAQRSEDLLTVVGSVEVVFADYGIDPPSSFVVLSVDDQGVMEFQLFYRQG